MTNLTDLELAALRNLTTSGYDGPTYWRFCATDGAVTAAAVGGVVSSLAKKGLVRCEHTGADATITITDAGLVALSDAR